MGISKLRNEFLSQLENWPMARANYEALRNVKRKEYDVGGFPLILQYNPARIRSTAAKVDAESIAQRPCFLCSKNRPAEQKVLEKISGWEVLVNPFPIFDEHYTIVSIEHRNQDLIDFADMASFVGKHPELVTFYNGSVSGASCPDHLHFQATRREYLPIIEHLRSNPGEIAVCEKGFETTIPDLLPAPALLFRTSGYNAMLDRWLRSLLVADDSGLPHPGKRNVLLWLGDDSKLYTLLILRSAHRPACWYAEGDKKKMVSPGAIDMTGFIILPREEDFNSLKPLECIRLLDEVGFDFRNMESYKNLLMRL